VRAKGVFGALGLRPAFALHSPAEGALLRRYSERATCVVEIGVAEGASAWEIRHTADPQGTIYLIDPYETGRIPGLNMARLTAGRLLRGAGGPSIEWIRGYSHEVSGEWNRPIDFLMIDGDHSHEAVTRDWREWSPHVRAGGIVALHDARVFENGWVEPGDGPVLLRESIERSSDGEWELIDGVDSLAIVRRVG
jgi:predicted O-methyltransferase YrrM